ncbi:PAS domain S-box protein [Lacibacter sediminis]|uniref:histidine kinase n=1 Tax=Lacibacter sediminis TaxID=2760713 RepID=A0A7G5XIH7_9BACT|nr:PAS domain S-box protein [Lacibacter sediminis]QNA45280.1 PAS domain S-box protein [Lacibacter sediminis]
MKNQQHSDHILATAFKKASVALAVINEQGFFVEVNEALCNILGYTKAELEQQPSSIIFPKEIQHEFSVVQHALFRQEQTRHENEWLVKTKDGSFIELLFTSDLFINENGERFLIQTVRNISTEKHSRQTTELTRQQYQAIIDNSLQAFFLTKPDGSILEANKAAEKMFGYAVEELCHLGRNAIIDNTDPRLIEKLKERQQKGFAVGELTGIRKNGEKFPLEFSSFVFQENNGELRTSTMLYDISERKKQEKELQKSQEEMASILNNTEEMFMIIDSRYNVINYNKATKERAKAILGKELNIGDSLLTLAVPERYAFVIAVYNKVLAGETVRYKHTVDRGKGTEIYQLTYSPVFDTDGTCSRFMVTVRDITGEENAISEIIRNQQLLQQAESIAHVGGWELDLVTNKLYWSDEVFRMCGYEPKSFEVTFEKGLSVIHPDDQASSIEEMQRAITGKSDYTAEKRFVRPDGSIRFIESKAKIIIDSNGNAVRLVGVFHDITEQKLMQRELAISQQEYKSLFDQNPDAVLSFDLTGKFISVNDAAMLLAETSREKLLTETFDSLIDAAEIETVRNYFREVKKGNSQRFRTVIATARGNRKTLAVSLMPIVIAGEITGVFGILKDVTTEKLYEEELEFQSHLLNAIQQSVIVTKLDGTVVYWNNFAEQLYGWQKQEAVGINIMQLTPTDMSMEQAKEVMKRLAAGESWSGEFLVKHKTKGPFKIQVHNSPFFDVTGKLAGIIGVSWDITKEVESREYIKFQANLLDNVEQAVIASDHAGTITYWNHFAEKLYGYSKQEAIGNNLSIILTDDPFYTKQAIEVMQLVAEGKSWAGEFQVRNKQNKNLSVFSLSSPVYDTDGNVQGVIGVSYDITERKQAEQQKEFERLDKEALINSTSDLIWSVNNNYQLIAANKAFTQSLENNYNIHLKPGDGVLVKGVFTDEQLKFWKEQYKRALNGEQFIVELHSQSANDQSDNWSEFAFNPIVNNEQVIGVACRGRDITQNKSYQRELLAINNRLEMAQQIAKLGYWSHDLKNDVLFWSKEVYTIFGLEEHVFKSDFNSFFCHIHPDDQEAFLKEQELVLKQNMPLDHEHRIVLPNGDIKYVIQKGSVIFNDEGEPVHVEGTIQDITDAKNAALALKVNEEQLNLIYNSTAGIIFLLGVENNGENFRFISMNNAGLTTIGLSQEDLFNRPVHEVIPEPSLSLVLDKYKEAVQSGKQVVWQEETAYPTGTKTGIVTVTPIYDSQGNCIRLVGSVNDITDLKLIEKSLAISRQEYKSLFDQNPDAVYSLDLEGRFTSFNPGLEQLLECRREDIIHAVTFIPFCHPDDLEKTMGHFLKVQQGEAQTYEVRAITFKGNQKHISISNMPIVVNGEITGVYGIAKDVTSEQLVLAQLELSNERYEYATKATNDVIWDWDLKTDKVVRAGSGFYVMFGYNEKDANNDDSFWTKKVHPEDLEQVLQKRRLVFSDPKQDFWEDEYRFLRSNGEFAFVYDRGYIFRNKEGKPLRMIGATKDITAQKLSELQLRELYDKLEERASQLQLSNTELERFAYIASHDLQEPLRMVSSFLQLLEKKYQDSIDEKGREYIRFAVDGSLRMKRLINDLLDYSRVTTRKQQLEPVNMELVISDVLQNLSLQIAEKNATIETSVLPQLPLADKTQMVQLIQNLVANALKYSGSKQPVIKIDASEKEDEWLFSVKDNGIGFDEKFVDKIFVIFQRLHNKTEYSGTGIGLAICKKIIDRHGGKIYAESVPGEGSTFWFTIKKQLVPEQ